MSKMYVIQWKSKTNGRTGRGTKMFDHEEAERLVQELNHEYPQIEHEAISVQVPESPAPQPEAQEPQLASSSVVPEVAPMPVLDPLPAL